MRCTLAEGMGTRAMKASFAMRKLLRAWPGGTHRSSPQNRCTPSHGMRDRNGSSPSSRYACTGPLPPVSATLKRPRARTASIARSAKLSASAAEAARASG